MVETLPVNAGDVGSIPGLGRWERQPTPVILAGETHGQRSLVGYSRVKEREQDQGTMQEQQYILGGERR